MDYKELKEFIKAVAKSGVSEVDIKSADLRIHIKVTPGMEGQYMQTDTMIQQVPMQTGMPTGMHTGMHTGIHTMIQQPMQTVVTQHGEPTQEAKTEAENNAKYVTIKSPMVGTFYRKPSPDKPMFVNVGDTVNKNSVVCIIEAMKLFNEIEAEVSGKIVKILVDDASPVEFDQPLYLVDPS